ncbi:GNAT family N-acetyltransferase [Nostoc sp. LPT]|uniref:GNAT family N-acetyltransferase n=1 Tax=Nostoc sp. LPT TaxID=2815387 RepID=UPI001DB3A12D|nr:GNAT family N-acetyltransferase [Nostoc sp. LPT]MBN4003566.1 GNAT family N-acetyltransferase [Nostoc sp. LPT]
MVKISEFFADEVRDLDFSEFQLWLKDWHKAGIYRCWLAIDKHKIVGFLTRNECCNCVAIEVLPKYRNQGIGEALCQESKTYFPAYNRNPKFWAAMLKRANS